MSERISSPTNLKIKRIVQLRKRRSREEQGTTIVEGLRELTRGLEAKIDFHELYYSQVAPVPFQYQEIIKRFKVLGKPVYEVPSTVFSKIAYAGQTQGILATGKARPLTFADFPKKQNPLYVIIERLEKPGNLGAILRTCDGAGVDGVIICDGKTDLYNPNVIRASQGAVFSVKALVSSNEEAVDFLRSRDIKICAAVPDAKQVYTDISFKGPLGIVVGSEMEGLSGFWLSHCAVHIRIPMRGQSDSLNVSTSTAILLYEAIRQRG